VEDSRLMPSTEQSPGTPPAVFVRLQQGGTWTDERSFTRSFTIGRAPDCDVVISEPAVSRRHAEVRWQAGTWQLADTGSRNGTYVDGARIQAAPLSALCRVTLGQSHAVVQLSVGRPADAWQTGSDRTALFSRPGSVTQLVQQLERQDSTADIGSEAQRYREAVARITKRQSRRHQLIVGVIGAILFTIAGVAVHQRYTLNDQAEQIAALRKSAEQSFYAMKQLELKLAELDSQIAQNAPAKDQQMIRSVQQELKSQERRYDQDVRKLGIYANMSERDQAVLRVARLFGECDATVPDDFLAEVNKYIQKWKTTGRLNEGMQRAAAAGYIGTISNALFTNKLPPQFFYVALQESGFNPKALGPVTTSGYAKGMWQFIPATATKYKLKVGPLQHVREFDPEDERFDPMKSTRAAAQYLKDIYLTDAQASGLLVIASYNWGEGNVIKKIRELPKNPQERNFWQLRKKFPIPQETHDYVFYIISAAVIGENPHLFGFTFTAPFATNLQ